MGGPWEDYSSEEAGPWNDFGAQAEAPASKPEKTYNVDVKSKSALAKNQLEMLKRNPDFKAMSPYQQARLLGSTGGSFGNPYKDAGLKELPRFAAEAVMTPINAAKKVATDIGTIGKTGLGALKGMLPGNDFMTELDKGAAEGTQMQKDFKPWGTGMEPSVTGQKIGEVFNAGEEGLASLTGNPELAKQVMGVATNTLGLGTVGAVPKIVKGVRKLASPVADLAVEKLAPSSWSPDGSPSKSAAPAVADKTQARLNRIQAKSPQVIDNRFENSAENLIPPDRTSADPTVRAAQIEKMKTGVDNIEQLAQEGAIHEHNAKGEVVLDENGAPKPYEVGKGGVVAAVKPTLQALDSVWNEVKSVLKNATDKDVKIPTQGVKGLEKFNGEMITPEQLQSEISALNEVLYKTKDGVLSLEDTAKRNDLKRAAGNLNTMLDDAVAKVLDDGTPGTKELHKQWGGVRHFTDAVLNGAERKLGGGLAPSVTDVPVHGGLGYKAVGTTTRLLNKFFKNPDSAFEAMIRARRAQGNNVRARVGEAPVVDTMPDLTTGARTQMRPNVTPEVLDSLQPAEYKPVSRAVRPDPVPPEYKPVSRPNTGGQPALVPDPMAGMDLKTEVTKAGGGKKAVADVAKTLGVPVAVLATWLLADEKKKKELAMLPAFAGLVAMGKSRASERLAGGVEPVKNFGRQHVEISLKGPDGKILTKESGSPYGVKSHLDPDTQRFVIEEIEVPENLKGQKLGSYLRQQVIEQAKKRGAKGISSSNYADTLDSRHMWETESGELRPGVKRSPYAVVDAKGGITTNDHGPSYWMDF